MAVGNYILDLVELLDAPDDAVLEIQQVADPTETKRITVANLLKALSPLVTDSTDGTGTFTILAGTIPGTVFTTSQPYIAGTLRPDWQGKLLNGSEFVETDPANGVFTVSYTISSGVMMATYQKQA